MNGDVADFLEDMDSSHAVIPPNMGFLQTTYHDHYDDDFHPDYPTITLPVGVKPVKGVNYRTAEEDRVND